MEKEGDVDYTEQLKWNDDESSCDMGHFLDQLEIGTMVWNGAKSSICDVFTKVGKKFVIEFQLKSGKTKYTRKNATDEAKKSVVFKCEHAGYKRIFVMICASGVKFDAIEEPVKMYDKNGAVSENIEVVIPTVEQLESFFNRSVLSEFQKTRK